MSSSNDVPVAAAAAAPFSLVWGELPALYLSYGTAALKGARLVLTDAVAAVASFTALSPPMGLDYLAVFDARRLGAAVAAQLSTKLAGAIAEKNPRFLAAPHDGVGWWRTVIREAFQVVLEEVSAGESDGAGNTAVVVLVLEKHIVIASSGACNAVLCHGGGEHVELTPKRRVRKLLAHPVVCMSAQTSALVIPELDVVVVERCQVQDEFLTLASGGLWGMVTPAGGDLADHHAVGVAGGHKGSLDMLVRELANKAVHAGSKDNASVAITLFRDFWTHSDGGGVASNNVPAAAPFSLVWGESPRLYLSYDMVALKGKHNSSRASVVIPEIDVVVVEHQAQDEFLILANSGLWGMVAPAPAPACAFMQQRLRWESPVYDRGSPDVLANKVVHAGSKDNVSVAVVLFRDL
ncbi:hypothetical protein HU200_049530 [Digitaria exilis]|uniref:protein-serine/threonine phosphatase n=1 Tax=Digitaria exilis TaxID=1010633 RepID=A0A835E6N2_9POAL|nr:hypothetical protein HU200_049530 [Digitaria exilis]